MSEVCAFVCETEGPSNILRLFMYSTNGSIAPTTEKLRFDNNDSLSEIVGFFSGRAKSSFWWS